MAAAKPALKQWCLVGNIVAAKAGAAPRATQHFAPGAKVYCLPAAWGDGYDQFTVIGHHQQANRYVAMVSPGERIGNWRAQAVYHADIARLLAQAAADSARRNWRSRQEVQTYVVAIKTYLATRAAAAQQ